MKGLAITCFSSLVGAAAAVFGFHHLFLRAGEEMPQIWPASIAAGVCSAAAVMFLILVAATLRERTSLRNATAGRLPRDGSRVILAGRIKALSPLTSPISGKRVVAYRYEMHRRAVGSRGALEIHDYSGTALTASTIATSAGVFRLLTVPMFDMATSSVDEVTARRNAQTYVAATHFQQKAFGPGSTPNAGSRATPEPAATDEQGNFRLDESESKKPDLAACTLDEWVIEQDAHVCVFGRYSQTRAAIVVDPNWANPARIMLGDANTVEATLGARIRNYLIGLTISTLAAIAVTSAYLAHVP